MANAMTKLVAVDALPIILGNMIAGNLVKRDFERKNEKIGFWKKLKNMFNSGGE